MDCSIKPLLKWAGGKTQILPHLIDKIPDHVENYAEPFIGAGALLFALSSKPNIKNIYISDVNPELIALYEIVRDYPCELIEETLLLEAQYNQKLAKGRKTFYYDIRARFNNNTYKKLGIKNKIKRVAQMLFLNRTCFNGLWRVNSSTGYFNVPFNKAGIVVNNNKIIIKKHTICFPENIIKASDFLKTRNTAIIEGGYENLLKWEYINSKNTFIYLDPPYRPLNPTSSFTAYSKKGFNDKEQIKLAQFFIKLSHKNLVMLSNSNPQCVNEKDTFFRDLYEKDTLTYDIINVNRSINSDKNKRTGISEILIYNS